MSIHIPTESIKLTTLTQMSVAVVAPWAVTSMVPGGVLLHRSPQSLTDAGASSDPTVTTDPSRIDVTYPAASCCQTTSRSCMADQTGYVVSEVCDAGGSGGTGGRSTPTPIPPHTWALTLLPPIPSAPMPPASVCDRDTDPVPRSLPSQSSNGHLSLIHKGQTIMDGWYLWVCFFFSEQSKPGKPIKLNKPAWKEIQVVFLYCKPSEWGKPSHTVCACKHISF